MGQTQINTLQRGNNRQPRVATDEDHDAFLGWLKEYSEKKKS